MHVLFVGATGAIGRQVVPILAKNFDLKLAALHAATVAEMPVAPCDITDFVQLLPLMKNVDAVVNCAIETRRSGYQRGIDSSGLELSSVYDEGRLDVNVRGAYYLYETAARCGVKKFVFISSMTAVLGQPNYEHIERDAAPRPENLYACTKLFGENLGSVYAHDEKRPMRVLALRLGQPYPSGTGYDTRWQESTHARSVMVALQDVAQAIECALLSDVNFGVYPILSRNDVNWIEVSAAQEIGYAPRFAFLANGLKESDAP